MTSTLYLPNRVAPTNLHLRDSVTVRMVQSDVYDIAKRMAEISRSLYAIETEEHGKVEWIIMEHCDDGVDRLVFRSKHFDGRVIKRLQELFTVDFKTRFKLCEQAEFKFEADRKEAELEALYDRFGRPMWTDLEKCGFITRPVSYPKTGVTGGKGSLSKAK